MVDYPSGTITTSLDTSSALAFLSSRSPSISIPGFVTGASGAELYSPCFFSNIKASNGVIAWSWYLIQGVTSPWYNVYATLWSCSDVATRTVIRQESSGTSAAASVSLEVTTIINGATTTIISGGSTSTYIASSGILPSCGLGFYHGRSKYFQCWICICDESSRRQ